MSKWKWILVVIVAVVIGYLVLSKVSPGIAGGIDDAVGPALVGGFSGIVSAITSHPVWVSWGNYICFGLGGIFIGLLLWQGHNAYNKVRQVAAQSAVKEAYGYQTVPTATPMAIPQTPTQTVTPQPVMTPTPTPAPEPKKEPTPT